jgi:hypothetical protein
VPGPPAPVPSVPVPDTWRMRVFLDRRLRITTSRASAAIATAPTAEAVNVNHIGWF